ncbi:hypothetical protein [Rhodopseudomonas sp. B29]|uniref:hypothetical protein n=1 Tax=Rhodopseudomonas sp. B29 TaxID=95607 RepID=UPI001FCABDA0|nr:hypothetical protein [Rhodopseudomonas sp. B29]
MSLVLSSALSSLFAVVLSAVFDESVLLLDGSVLPLSVADVLLEGGVVLSLALLLGSELSAREGGGGLRSSRDDGRGSELREALPLSARLLSTSDAKLSVACDRSWRGLVRLGKVGAEVENVGRGVHHGHFLALLRQTCSKDRAKVGVAVKSCLG